LREFQHWLNWRYELRDDHWVKPPYCPENGRKASSTDPNTWRSYESALATYQMKDNPPYDGIGFVFATDDPLTGVDLDECRNPETGQVEEWARVILAQLDTYTEVSPSG